MRAYIPNFNRLRWVPPLLSDLRRLGCEPVIVDMSSSYPPLLEWYKKAPCEIVRSRNVGPRGIWSMKLLKPGEFFLVCDPDLDLSGVPDDALPYILTAFQRHPSVMRIGLSLRIDDLPATEYVARVKEYEKNYWTSQTEDGLYRAAIDTTFVVCRPECAGKFDMSSPSLRTPAPYAARHLPWYEDIHALCEEDSFYLDACTRGRRMPTSIEQLAACEPDGRCPLSSRLVQVLRARRAKMSNPSLEMLEQRSKTIGLMFVELQGASMPIAATVFLAKNRSWRSEPSYGMAALYRMG